MAHGDPGWELYRSFLEVVRDGSLSGAARRLATTQPTIGRHIAALEAVLNLALFTRSQRGLSPTQAALDLLPHAEAMAVAAAAITRAASAGAGDDHGTVRLTASVIVGCEVLPPILAGFRRHYPAITLELALSNRNEDLLRRDADIAVRMVRPTQKALRVQRLGQVGIGLYAHQSYIEAFGAPVSIADLATHCVIGFDQDDSAFRSIGQDAGRFARDQFRFRCDNDLAQLAALRAGIGIGGCQSEIAARTADLVRVLPHDIDFKLEMWLAMHEDLKATRRVRLLFDHLRTGLTEYLAGSSTASDAAAKQSSCAR
jgi:DNA-binding transcriptional LysR family regulator